MEVIDVLKDFSFTELPLILMILVLLGSIGRASFQDDEEVRVSDELPQNQDLKKQA